MKTQAASHICCVLSVTEYMDLETRGGKVINHASHSLVFFLPLPPPRHLRPQEAVYYFVFTVTVEAEGFLSLFFLMQIWFLFKQMGGGGVVHCMLHVAKVYTKF